MTRNNNELDKTKQQVQERASQPNQPVSSVAVNDLTHVSDLRQHDVEECHCKHRDSLTSLAFSFCSTTKSINQIAMESKFGEVLQQLLDLSTKVDFEGCRQEELEA